jgi:hypothetical protein
MISWLNDGTEKQNNTRSNADSLYINRVGFVVFMAITKFLVKSRNNICDYLNYKS